MTSKRLLHRSLVGMRVGTAAGQAGSGSHAADGKPYGKTGAPVDCGIMLACKSDHSSGSFLYTLMLDDGTLRDPRENVLLNGIDLTAPGKEKFIFDPKIVGINRSHAAYTCTVCTQASVFRVLNGIINPHLLYKLLLSLYTLETK